MFEDKSLNKGTKVNGREKHYSFTKIEAKRLSLLRSEEPFSLNVQSSSHCIYFREQLFYFNYVNLFYKYYILVYAIKFVFTGVQKNYRLQIVTYIVLKCFLLKHYWNIHKCCVVEEMLHTFFPKSRYVYTRLVGKKFLKV